jgi:hypothetical protein
VVRDLYIEVKRLDTLEKENIVPLMEVVLETMSTIECPKKFLQD